MKILLLGSGGREHAIAWKLAQSPKLKKLFIAPGNAGTAQVGTNINIDAGNHNEVKEFVLKEKIELLVIGPEAPLVEGIHDFFLNDEQLKNVGVVGPQRNAAMLEGSKDFAKEFMQRHEIPTASYKTFDKDSLNKGLEYLETLKPPYVLKADGLAAGKGVLICDSLDEAKFELNNMISDSKFGEASAKVVVEEFLSGIELSVFVLTDGDSYKILPVAKDYKRIGEADTGLNTGGMGSISHVPFANKDFMEKVENRIIKPTIIGLKKEKISYKGFIFFGLINVENNPFVIEYNVRMGDPEAESVIPRIKSDLLELFKGVADNDLHKKEIKTDERYTAAIMLVSGGYPGSYEKGKQITGIDETEDCIVFHAGTKSDFGNILTNGGRVLAVTSFGKTMDEALERSYKNAAKINFEGRYYRSDLGFDIK